MAKIRFIGTYGEIHGLNQHLHSRGFPYPIEILEGDIHRFISDSDMTSGVMNLDIILTLELFGLIGTKTILLTSLIPMWLRPHILITTIHDESDSFWVTIENGKLTTNRSEK